jgi:ABC-type proline/glycine betaine transport system substrate-binding protein
MWFSITIGCMIAFTVMNFLITKYAPDQAIAQVAYEKLKSNSDAKEAAEKEAKKYPLRQDQFLYAEVLNKIQNEICSKVSDKENNDFYTCPDGSKISQVHWTRGSDRKGVVTKYYDSTGKNVLIYGHPDDVY